MASQPKRHRIALLVYSRPSLVELGLRPQDTSGQRLQAWLRKMPELQVIADLRPFFLSTGKRSPVDVASWQRLATWIALHSQRFDGFVILHQLETLLYTANAVTFLLKDLHKPVVFTGSPAAIAHVHRREPRLGELLKGYELLGFKVNLLNSVQVATLDIGETMVMFGSRLIRAVRAMRSRTLSTNFFDAFGDEYLGVVDFGVKLTGPYRRRSRPKVRRPGILEERIFSLDLHPGFDLKTLETIPFATYRGVIVRYSDQSLLDAFLKFARERFGEGSPVILYSRSVAARPIGAPNAIFVNNVTYEAAFTKLMWALGQTDKLGKLRKLFEQNVVGEGIKV